jgi:YVTN family beta-propeller protein
VNPGTDIVYVTDGDGNAVSVINGKHNKVTATVGVGTAPYGVGVDPATSTAYVANDVSNTVSVITRHRG